MSHPESRWTIQRGGKPLKPCGCLRGLTHAGLVSQSNRFRVWGATQEARKGRDLLRASVQIPFSPPWSLSYAIRPEMKAAGRREIKGKRSQPVGLLDLQSWERQKLGGGTYSQFGRWERAEVEESRGRESKGGGVMWRRKKKGHPL